MEELRISTEYNEVDKAQWNYFVSNHPAGNIFHTPEIVELYEQSSKHKPMVVICLNLASEIVGILVADMQSEYSGVLGKITARAIVWGGPLIKDQNTEIGYLLLKEFDIICKKNVVYSQFRNLWNTGFLKNVFSDNKFKFEEHLDIFIDLKKGKESIWGDFHPTRRKQINRGIKREIISEIVDKLNNEDFNSCLEILRLVYGVAKLPFPKKDFFSHAFDILIKKKHLRIALARYKNEIIGFRFFLCYKGLLYDWYAGSRSAHYDKYPNDILPWEILKWGADNGYTTFVFGGAGKPNVPYGVRDYKMKFGGSLVNFGRFVKIHKPFLMIAARTGFKFWKLLRK